MKNGEPFSDLIDPITNWFTLDKGSTALSVYPEDVATVKVKFRERWL